MLTKTQITVNTNQTIKTIVRELPADLETPISVYLKLRDENPSFLLESVEGGERIARYSFIGIQPYAQYILRGTQVEIIQGVSNNKIDLEPGSDPTLFLQGEMARFESHPQSGLPRFIGGLVGYMSYETVRYFEPTLISHTHAARLPDACYLLADTVVAFDHARRSLFLIANVLDGDEPAANRKLDLITDRLHLPLPESRKQVPQNSVTT